MARDLTREVQRRSRNGDEVTELVDEVLGRPDPETPVPADEVPRIVLPAAAERLEARRDWMLARIAVMLIDAAKLLDPITRIVVARLIAIGALVAATGVAFYAIRLTEGWERVAVAGIFTALAALLIRKGQS